MSDLQCAATFLIAGHCEAQDDAEPQEDGADVLTATGREQMGRLADSLKHRGLALVYSAPAAAALRSAEILSAELGTELRTSDALGSGTRMMAELNAAADLHRGETVLVVSDVETIAIVVRALAPAAPAASTQADGLASCQVVELAVDADGWVVRTP